MLLGNWRVLAVKLDVADPGVADRGKLVTMEQVIETRTSCAVTSFEAGAKADRGEFPRVRRHPPARAEREAPC